MQRFALLLLVSLLAACASTPKVTTDINPEAAFDHYRTYRWIQPPQGVSPLLQQRIVDGVNSQLAGRGWLESVDADVAIAAHVATQQHQDVDTFYHNVPVYAGWGWRTPWATVPASTSVRTYEVGTLVVDLFDTRTRQAVWRGSAKGTIPSSQEQLNEGVQSGITEMFKQLPAGR